MHGSVAQRYNDSLNRLKHIQEVDLPVQNVPSHAALRDAISIFDWVNSQGTRLTDAELALTHVTGKWSQARRVMKKETDDLGKQHFPFDLTFLTRALTGVVTNRALFFAIHDRGKVELEQGWARLEGILDYLTAIADQDPGGDRVTHLDRFPSLPQQWVDRQPPPLIIPANPQPQTDSTFSIRTEI